VAIELAPLWIVGLALCLIAVVHILLRGSGLGLSREAYEWVQYAAIGLAFPLLLTIVASAQRRRTGWPAWQIGAERILVALVLVAVGWLQLRAGSVVVMLMAAIQVLVMTWATRRTRLYLPPARLISSIIVAGIGWAITIQAVDFGQLPPIAIVLVALVSAVALTSFSVGDLGSVPSSPFRLWTTGTVVGIALLALASLGTAEQLEVFGQWGALHHWGPYVGAAELVRQGHWLYWDVPSAYGLLSITILALLPTGSAWESLYIVSVLLLFLSASMLFLLLRFVRTDWLGWVFAMATTLAVVYFNPLLLSRFAFHGPLVFPSVGAFRFFWVYALLALLVWESRTKAGGATQRQLLIGGCFVWLIGVFWSPESALYTSAAWLPAYGLIVARRVGGRTGWPRAAAWLTLPVGLVLVASTGLVAYYVARLGHPPDGYALVEYILAFTDDLLSVPLGLQGPVLGILALFLLLAIAAYPILRAGIGDRALPLVVGLWGGLWASHTYFFSRWGIEGMFRLTPLGCAVVALALVLAARPAVSESRRWLVRVAAVPPLAVVLAGVIAATVSDPVAIANDFDLRRSLVRGGVEQTLPRVEPALAALFDTVGVRPEDPVVYAGDTLGNLMPFRMNDDGLALVAYRSWLPTLPLTTFGVLPEERKALYIERFVQRAPASGWFIQRKVDGRVIEHHPYYQFASWLLDAVLRTHVPTRVYESAEWQLVWFEHVGQDPTVVRPQVQAGKLEALPSDLLVEGESQGAGQAVWGLFGPGWEPVPPSGGLAPRSPATISIYTPDARRVALRAKPSVTQPGTTAVARTLRVAVDGKETTSTTITAGQPWRVVIDLRPGWTIITLDVAGGRIVRADSDPGSGTAPWDSYILGTIDIVTRR